MSTYLYQLEKEGNWVLGTKGSNPVSGNYFIMDMKFVSGVWNVGVVDPKDNSHNVNLQPVTEYKKEDGTPYRSIEEFRRICGTFFNDGPLEGVKPKKYTVLLTQTSTNHPVVTILEDTITGITVARTGVGTYTFTKAGAFVVGKAIPGKAEQFYDKDSNRFVITPTSVNVYTLQTYAAADDQVLADGVLSNQFLNLEIY